MRAAAWPRSRGLRRLRPARKPLQPCDAASTRIAVRTDRVVGSLPKFWRCTGFTPAELLLYPEMRQTLSFLGAIPNRGIEFVRVHFLLDLIGATRGGGRHRL